MIEPIDGYLCMAEYCDKELIDGQPPCCECGNLISLAEYATMQERFFAN